jgi:hypothetical protein
VNLLSIDLERGVIRHYVSVEGNKPKAIFRVDVPNYTRDMGWDKDQLEAYRQDPRPFHRAAEEQHDGPEAA